MAQHQQMTQHPPPPRPYPIASFHSSRQARLSPSLPPPQHLNRPCVFPAVHYRRRKTARKCKTNHINAARNLINEAWENVSHNTCLHKSSTRRLTKARCCWRTEQRGHTHVIPLGLGRHCLFDGCQQSAHLVWQTVLWHYRGRRRRSVLPLYEGKDGKSI